MQDEICQAVFFVLAATKQHLLTDKDDKWSWNVYSAQFSRGGGGNLLSPPLSVSGQGQFMKYEEMNNKSRSKTI